MVEVADINPVGNDRLRSDLDVEVAVHRVVTAEHTLVANPQGALVGAQAVFIADVDPSAEDQPAIARAGVELDPLADEHETLSDDVRVTELEPEETPVVHEIPRRPSTVSPYPAQRCPRQESRLPRVASSTSNHAADVSPTLTRRRLQGHARCPRLSAPRARVHDRVAPRGRGPTAGLPHAGRNEQPG